MIRKSSSPVVDLMRQYVTDYINRHDFSVIANFLAEDYTLHTGGLTVTGRDGPYRQAVAKQLDQFPGLVFTLHEIHHAGDAVAVRFTEHGASLRHQGRTAAWPSIAIYKVRDGRLASCHIEQDYFSRKRQLDDGTPIKVDAPAVAPWDTPERPPEPEAEATVRRWLADGAFLSEPGVQVDDARATGVVEQVVEDATVDVMTMVSAGDRVAFHAVQTGRLAGDFAPELSPAGEASVRLHLSGLVGVSDGRITSGNVIRDRWGLYRRLSSRGQGARHDPSCRRT